MIGLVLLAIGLVGQWLLGFALADLLTGCFRIHHADDVDPSPNLTERIGLGFVLGIGFTSGLLFLWSLSGGTLGPAASFSITGIGYVAGGLAIGRELVRRRSRAAFQSAPLQTADLAQEKSWQQLCQVLIAGLFLFTTIQTLMTPQHLWDERASFAIKGLVLNLDHSIHSRDLLDPNFVQFHPRYPLLIPLAEQHIYSLLGTIDDRLSKLMFPELYLGLILVLAGGLGRHLTDASSWFFALLASTMPVLVPWEYGFPCGQADASMACFHGVSVFYLWNALRGITGTNVSNAVRSSVLAGLCGAMAAFTKDEGIAFLMVDAVAVSLVVLFSRQWIRGLSILVSVFGVAAACLIPWILHRQRLPLTTEANYMSRVTLSTLMQRRANLEWEIPHLVRRMFWEFREWGLQWWLMLFAAIAAPLRLFSASQLFLVLDVVGSILSLLLAGMVAETEVSEHIGGSSHRYLMQLAPVAILFAAGQLGLPRRRLSDAAETLNPPV